MAIPTSRDQLKEHCLRRLGKPVVDINVDDEQVEDRVDEALLYYRDYHFDGSERVYYKLLISNVCTVCYGDASYCTARRDLCW